MFLGNTVKIIGKWVQNQRAQYKYVKQGKPSNITEKRIQNLENTY